MSTCDVTVCIAHLPDLPDRRMHLAAALLSVLDQTVIPTAVRIETDRVGAGCGPTKNKLIDRVETEWIAWLDDDDWFLPHHLETLWGARESADLIYPRGRIHYADGRVVDWPVIEYDERVLRDHNYIPVTYLIRTELARAVRFPDDPEPANDHRFLLGAVDAGAVFRHVPEVTWCWRQWGGNRRSFEGMAG